jgi:hypothetical protein
MPQLTGSWRSTAVGTAGGIATLLIQAYHVYKGQPLDEAAVTSAVTFIMLGLLVRDNKVSSEEVGAK